MQLGPFILALCFAASISSVWTTTSKPCASQQTDYGYVCVCNSTYCDTILAPTKLKSGKYYHYTTSETSPGFNVKKGSFETSQRSLYDDTSDVYVTVDSSTTYQTMMGLGLGISDSSAYVYSELSAKSQKNLMASFYGSTGIELTFARIPLGDTDFSLDTYTYDDTVDDFNMTYFNLTTFETETRIPVILAAVAASERTLNLLATPWTSPYWMKDNNDSAPGFLIPSYHEAFSKYIIKFLDAHKEYGLEYWGVSPMNEVIFGASVDFSMPNVMIMPSQLRSWMRDYMGPMLKEAYEDVKLLALDDERPYLTWYGEALLSDNETAQYIDGFAVHWYADSDSNTYIADDFHTNYPDVFLLLTEASGNDQSQVSSSRKFGESQPGPNPTGGFGPTGGSGPTGGFGPTGGGGGGGGGGGSTGIELGSWSTGLKYISSMIQNFQHWSVGYMAWNMCLNTDGGPDTQMSQEAPIIVNTTSDEFYKQPFYYAFGHFSKFMYPDSVRIGLTVESSTSTTVGSAVLSKKKTTTTTTTTTANPQPSGGAHTGGPGPNPTGGSFTGGFPTGGGHSGGFGPNPTGSSTTSSFDGIATTNPDGSTTVILSNPSSDSVTVVITDAVAGTITTTVDANSLNTFIYW